MRADPVREDEDRADPVGEDEDRADPVGEEEDPSWLTIGSAARVFRGRIPIVGAGGFEGMQCGRPLLDASAGCLCGMPLRNASAGCLRHASLMWLLTAASVTLPLPSYTRCLTPVSRRATARSFNPVVHARAASLVIIDICIFTRLTIQICFDSISVSW